MKAVILKEPGGVDNLILADLPVPAVAPADVLVQVKAISINPVDAFIRASRPLPPWFTPKAGEPVVLGWDISGIITEIGSDATDFKPGDAVFGMVHFPGHGQAYAEYVAAPASQLALKPDNVSHESAAAATLAALTAWQSLVNLVKIKPGDRVLIHAAAGGVGHYAVQLAKYLGAYVIGTSSAVNRDFVLGLGANEHIDYTTHTFDEELSDIDFVLDPIGRDTFERSLTIIRPGGTLVGIVGNKAVITEKARAKSINGFRQGVTSNGDDMRQLADLLAKGVLRSHVSDTFSLDQLPEAHTLVETGKTKGKLIVTV
ncbi:NADP-dependent oxidoreductase [Spirosoma endbachense]|uniref:Zinc-binding dehydrogenase n=1 Tax=Spirosoma endbachense TaxID=2666025 RepID=A0A6P1W0D4_9BACT|nr:NADP-dependent oxidoreductase [Spirosoma endbachense]QHV97470.1 zinc-binding dehydrogenase [Spirosoma endbachense]